MIIAQISDLHVAEDGDFMRRLVDANAHLERAVTYLNGLTRRPDVVLATGDLTDHGRTAEYGLLTDILEQLEIPLFCIPGNHDERDAFREAFLPSAAYLPSDGPVQYVVDDFPVRLVAVDTIRAGHHDGEVDPARLAWLDETLAARPDVPTVVFLHHPPFKTGIWWMDCIGLAGASDLEAVVRRHPQVQRVLAGHLHRPIVTTWGSTVVSTAPSTTHQTRCDLDPEHGPIIAAEPSMLDLHWWTGNQFVSHTTVFEDAEPRIEIAAVLADWDQAKARIKEGPPFAKGGMFG